MVASKLIHVSIRGFWRITVSRSRFYSYHVISVHSFSLPTDWLLINQSVMKMNALIWHGTNKNPVYSDGKTQAMYYEWRTCTHMGMRIGIKNTWVPVWFVLFTSFVIVVFGDDESHKKAFVQRINDRESITRKLNYVYIYYFLHKLKTVYPLSNELKPFLFL